MDWTDAWPTLCPSANSTWLNVWTWPQKSRQLYGIESPGATGAGKSGLSVFLTGTLNQP
jgi:hypothetical protein